MKTLSDNVLRGLTKHSLIKTIKELYAMREEAIEYLNSCNDNDVDTRFYGDKKPRKYKLLNILQGNKEEE